MKDNKLSDLTDLVDGDLRRRLEAVGKAESRFGREEQSLAEAAVAAIQHHVRDREGHINKVDNVPRCIRGRLAR